MADTASMQLDEVVEARIGKARDQIERSLRQIARGNPLGAETSPERALARMRAKLGSTSAPDELDAARLTEQMRQTAEAIDRTDAPETTMPPMVGPEAIIGNTLDFLGVSFLSRGRKAADAVARIIFRNGTPQGSGFLVAPGVLLTNQHVIANARAAGGMVAQFDYEADDVGQERETTEFDFDTQLFVSDPQQRLDYALVALGRRVKGPRTLETLPFLPLSASGNKHMLGEVANIVQHPKGRLKELVLRENRLVSRLDAVLHYIADTEKGSSGSPVFNNDWQVIALHHWGGPGPMAVRQLTSKSDVEFNEGVRASSIVTDLGEKRRGGIAGADRLARVLELWSRSDGTPVSGRETALEIKMEATRSASSRSRPMPRRDIDFSDRAGYEPGFLRGHVIDLPKLTNVRHEPAPNLEARRGDDAFELPYHHFSIVMNADRRLAFFTACNIDGKHSRHVDRDDGKIKDDWTLRQRGLENAEDAEASGGFRLDTRLHREHQLGTSFYAKQKVPGYSNPNDRGRTARMLQKGHIIMRNDPAWGSDEATLAAEQDTFFYTNAAPQLGFFNQGSREDHPGEKYKLRWRAVETFVLRNAVTMNERVSVFAGPVFRDRARDGLRPDPVYRQVQIPMQFWKIVTWQEDGRVNSVALLAEQWSVLDKLTNGIPEAMEAVAESFEAAPERFDDASELRRVEGYISTVEEIEALTGLVFADPVRGGDLNTTGALTRRASEAVGASEPAMRTLLHGPKAGPARAAAIKGGGAVKAGGAKPRRRRAAAKGAIKASSRKSPTK
jgi:endonuclease G